MAHIEKERRKKKNAAERKRLLAELKINEKKNSSAIAQLTEKDNDVDMEENESGDDESSDEALSDAEEEQETGQGLDRLASSARFDIPRVSDIPVVSELARERAREMRDQKPAPEVKTKKTKDQVARVIEDEDMELETHFVENPFIKIRQRAARKLEGPTEALGVEDFVNDQETDIILMKDENKLVVKDLEKMDRDAARAKVLKRKHQETFGYGDGLYMSSDDEGKDRKPRDLQSLKSRLRSRSSAKGKPQEEAPARKRDLKKIKNVGGHQASESGAAYRSSKGKGDVLKAGTHEPYAYIKLNPEMLNPKKKAQAVGSFAAVVSHGKKTDKRTGKRKEGLLAGMSVKRSKSKSKD